eukprot:6205152-Pleurochrysis_carterae.AAC.1
MSGIRDFGGVTGELVLPLRWESRLVFLYRFQVDADDGVRPCLESSAERCTSTADQAEQGVAQEEGGEENGGDGHHAL